MVKKRKKIQQNPFCLFNFESLIGTIQNNGYRALSSWLFVSFVMFFWLLLIFYLVVFFFFCLVVLAFTPKAFHGEVNFLKVIP